MSLELWTVYDHPRDAPEWFLARKYVLDGPTAVTVRGRTLDDVRSLLPPGLFCLKRHPADDPAIVEVWL